MASLAQEVYVTLSVKTTTPTVNKLVPLKNYVAFRVGDEIAEGCGGTEILVCET